VKLLLTRPWNRTSMLIPNHGLGYLATALKKEEHHVDIVDCIRDRIGPKQLANLASVNKYKIIGFQVYTFDLKIFRKYLEELTSSDCILIAGGPHPSSDPVNFLGQFHQISYCIRGEAESSLPKLIELLDREPQPRTDQLAEIPGLYYRDQNLVCGSDPEYVSDLDSLGFPDWSQISPSSYPVAPQGTFTQHLPYAPIIITRGCPYPCTFCAGKLISGKKIRSRSVQHVITELQFLSNTYGIKEFHIQDDNFTHDRDYVIEFCSKLIDSGLNLSWSCPNGIRLDSVDEKMLSAMESAGCYSVAVGIESGSQRILDLMKKKTSVSEISDRINLIRRVTSWHITGFFILGYPGETESEMIDTIKYSKQLPIDKANFGILMPLPGTEASKAAQKMGWNPEKHLFRMSEYRSPFNPPGIHPWKFKWLFIWAYCSFYARPKILIKIIRQIHSWDQLKILAHRLWDVIIP